MLQLTVRKIKSQFLTNRDFILHTDECGYFLLPTAQDPQDEFTKIDAKELPACAGSDSPHE